MYGKVLETQQRFSNRQRLAVAGEGGLTLLPMTALQQEGWLLAATHWMVAPLLGAWGAQPPPARVAKRLYILAEHSSPWLPVHIPAHATQLVEEQNET